MKKLFLIIALSVQFIANSALSKDWTKLNIFACTPEWGSLATEITGDKTNIFVATTAMQDPHYIEVSSNMISQIIKADIVFCSGADLEVKWLPILLQKASKSQIQEGGVGYFMASDYVNRLEIPKTPINLNQGDIHPFGNPHVHLDPRNISVIAAKFLALMNKLDPDNADVYNKNYNDFMNRWNKSIVKWEKDAEDLKDLPIIVRHNQWSYLVNWLKLNVVATLEEKPGVAPSAKYMSDTLKTVAMNHADMIIYAPFENKRIILWMRVKSKTKDVMLPFTVGGEPRVKNLFDLFDYTINTLKRKRKAPAGDPSQITIDPDKYLPDDLKKRQ